MKIALWAAVVVSCAVVIGVCLCGLPLGKRAGDVADIRGNYLSFPAEKLLK